MTDPRRPYITADPIPEGWTKGEWYKVYNNTNSRIRNSEGQEAAVVARGLGRTRTEAIASRAGFAATQSEARPLAPKFNNTLSNSQQQLAIMAVTLAFTYPLTSSQAEQVVKIYEEDTTKLNEDLESVRTICADKCKSTTNSCVEHSKEVRRLWRTYYTSIRAGSWASYRSIDYVTEIRKLFDGRADIHQIHARVAKEKRMHHKDALCTGRIDDDPMVKKYKEEAAAMFQKDTPESHIREFIRIKELEVAGYRSPKQAEYDSRLAACQTEEEKRAVHREHACAPVDSDTLAMVKLRLKWQGLFDNGMPYAEIYAITQKDIADHIRIERELKEKLDGLQRAKAAHSKAEIAKEAKKAAKETATRISMLSKYTFYCTTEGCQNLSVPISQDQGNLECGICHRLAHDGVPQDRSYFCSEECMERGGYNHIITAHACAAAAGCTTGVFKRSVQEDVYGFCGDCRKHFDVISYFCTDECWTKNYDDHVKYVHTKLRIELVDKLENDKEFFGVWARKMHLTDEEVRTAMTGVNFAAEAPRPQ